MPSEESFKKIEGAWKDFRFRRIQPKDHPAVFEHIAENFVRDEPTSKLLGWNKEFADDVNRVVEFFLKKDDMSFLLEHVPTGEIAGVRITFHHTPDVNFDTIPLHSRNGQLLLKLVDECEARADVANKYKITDWAEFFIASTSKSFRNVGIAGEFYDRSLAFLKSEGYKNALVLVSSPYTRAACTKRGFEQASRMDYGEFKDFEGNSVFKEEDLTSDHFALVMMKHL